MDHILQISKTNELLISNDLLEKDKHKPLVLFFYDNKHIFEPLVEQMTERNELRFVSTNEMNDAISLFYNHSLDCIVLIDSINEGKALELYEAISYQCKSQMIPVVYIGEYSKEGINRIYEKGINEFLAFPFEIEEVYLKIRAKIESNNVIKQNQQIDMFTGLYNESFLKKFYQLQMADVARLDKPFTIVLVSIHKFNDIRNTLGPELSDQLLLQISSYISTQIRDSDMVFRMDSAEEIAILLRHSGQKEAGYFVQRLFEHIPAFPEEIEWDSGDRSIHLAASILEVGNTTITYGEVMERGKAALQEAIMKGPSHIEVIDPFSEPEVEKIKVTIIESDEVIRSVLLNLLERMQLDYVELEIQTFEDGYQFLESTWYQSSHKHIVILDDVLPKKDGFEVLYELRNMPNTEKYIVIMLSTRKTENDMIYSFELGVDDYITKPFHVKLIESRIKRYVKRLR